LKGAQDFSSWRQSKQVQSPPGRDTGDLFRIQVVCVRCRKGLKGDWKEPFILRIQTKEETLLQKMS
jgi:hypothetical protein